MSRTHILLIFLLLPLTLRSQEDICIGKELVLYSTVLQEDRSYWIHLPEHYNMDTKQRYPVVYLLDGDSFFHSLVGIRKTLASGRGKYLPPCIIVGVLNTRFRKEGEVRLSVSFLRKNFALLSIVPIARTAGICLSVIRMRGFSP